MNDCTALDNRQLATALTEEDVLKADLGEEHARMAFDICARLASEHVGLEDIAAEIIGGEGEAAARKFYRWRVRSDTLARIYARACISRTHVLAHRAYDIVDKEPCPQKARVKLDAIKWACAKFNRAEFGDDPVTVQGVGGGAIQHEHTHTGSRELLDQLAKIVAKRRALIEQREGIEDAQVIDAQAVEVAREKREPSSTPGGPAEDETKAGVSAPPTPTPASRTKAQRRKSRK